MEKNFFGIIRDIVDYIFNIKVFDLPLLIAYLGVSAIVGYCASLILIGFPCSIYKSITKKEINDEIENKVIRIVAICLVIVLYGASLYQLSQRG